MSRKNTPRNSPEIIARIAAGMERERHNAASLASLLGMTRQWGYALMRNEILISAHVLSEIAKILGVSMDSLWTGKDDQGDKNTLDEYVRAISRDEYEKLKNQ